MSPVPENEVSWVARGLLALVRAARALALPLAACALVAVGVHAAADTVGDRILSLVDRVQVTWDSLMGRWQLTRPLVDLVGLSMRTRLARSVTLVWELIVDAALAAPSLTFLEPEPAGRPRDTSQGDWRSGVRRFMGRAEPMLWARPACTAAMVIAGACNIATMVQGSVFFDLDRGSGAASTAFAMSRLAAIVALGGVVAVIGWRPIIRSVQRVALGSQLDIASAAKRRRLVRGLWGTALAFPLAVAAIREASPVLGFFR